MPKNIKESDNSLLSNYQNKTIYIYIYMTKQQRNKKKDGLHSKK